MTPDPTELVREARDDLSLLARMVVSRSEVTESDGVVVIKSDADAAEMLRIPRVQEEITMAVSKVYGATTRYE